MFYYILTFLFGVLVAQEFAIPRVQPYIQVCMKRLFVFVREIGNEVNTSKDTKDVDTDANTNTDTDTDKQSVFSFDVVNKIYKDMLHKFINTNAKKQ